MRPFTKALFVLSACVAHVAGLASQQLPPRDTSTPSASVPRPVGPVGTSILSGTVVSDDSDSRPLRRAVVIVSGSGVQPSRVSVTDDAGRFTFRGLPAGNLTLETIKPGYLSTRYGQKRPGRGPGVVLSLGAGQQLDGLIVRVPRGSAITGTITDETGRPRRNVVVSIFESRIVNGVRRFIPAASSAPGGFSTSDDRGVYRLYGLAPGEYIVAASLGNAADMGPNLDIRRASPAELQWAAERLRGSGSSAGVVPGMGLPPESGPSPAPGQRVGLSPVYYPGTTDMSAAVSITLGRGEERQSVDFLVSYVAAARVEGKVVAADGQPVSGVQLRARRSAWSLTGGTRSSGDGTFSIGNLAPGAYTILARATGGRGAGASPGLWANAEIAVNGQDVSNLSLVLLPGLTLGGRVVFTEPLPVPLAQMKSVPFRVTLSAVSDGLQLESPSAQLSTDGTFTVTGIVPGRYRLTAASPSTPATGNWVLHSATLDGRDISDVPLEVGATSLSGVVVTLSRRLAEVTGTLFDAAGRPTPDYFVVVFSTNRDHWIEGSRRVPPPVRPSTNGTYKVATLPAGSYYLAALTDVDPEELFDRAFLEQVAAGAMTITLSEGETKVQDLKLAGQTPAGK